MSRKNTWHSALAVAALAMISFHPAQAANWAMIGWNNLGMHCIDADYSVFSLLPPYNTIYAQLITPQGTLVGDATGVSVTYEAIADPDASRNTTSIDKTNFWQNVQALFGVTLDADVGLKGAAMPGTSNQPQPMTFDASGSWFGAEGIPITPYDDAGHKNPYPLMHLVARDGSGTVLATTDIVLPVSDETDCSTCHASGSDVAARPLAGWVYNPDPQRDFRLNILRLHDEKQASDSVFQAALAAVGYDPAGLYVTAGNGKAILCAACHGSEALGTSGQANVAPLTRSVHGRHAAVTDPVTGLTLESSNNRSACYRCHPGSVTRCLRGVMGASVAADGTLAIQCQSCHGSMSAVAAPTRTGWLNEPACQQCHTGTATHNNGEIRYTSALDITGQPRVAVDQTFATNPDTPGPGFSLYRFSNGHGGVNCEGCHGSTHAEFPSSHRNDNIQSIQHQGHIGMLVECDSCHGTQPVTISGGPHGMHPIGQTWVATHGDAVGEGGNTTQCRACHGGDYRGTVLSRSQAIRTVTSEDVGSKQFWRGFQIGCYTCHLGPGNSDPNPNRAAVVTNADASTTMGAAVTVALTASDADGDPLTLRVVSQPAHGTAAIHGTQATYFPEPGFTGGDSFTFAAWDGSTDSNLGTVSLSVASITETPTPPTATPTATTTMPTPATETATPATTTPTQTSSPAPPIPCVGDCHRDGVVTVEEILVGIDIALGNLSVPQCQTFDVNGDGQVTVDEILQAVSNALDGCPVS
jgi:hypothetical protein